MPASYAHLLITEKAMKQLIDDESIERQLRGCILTHSHFTFLGSIGPDYPYLDLLDRKQTKWADHMHYDHTGDIIKTFVRVLHDIWNAAGEKEEFAVPFCWTMGYVSHVIADLVIHPVVANIVGPYNGHETEHRECEMIQDAYIYNKFRSGAEIEHSGLIDIIRQCSKTGDSDRINPILGDFWDMALRWYFESDFLDNHPDIDKWHDRFEDFLGLAGDPPFIGRILDSDHKYTYRKSTQIAPNEMARFIKSVPLPDGNSGSYDDIVVPKAIGHVADEWKDIITSVISGDFSVLDSGSRNCNLDDGKELGTGNIIYWEES